jgi:hypothetical protein
MYYPVFTEVLDLGAVKERLPSLPADHKTETLKSILKMLQGNGRSNIDNEAVTYLLKHFGRDSNHPCLLTPLLPETEEIPESTVEDGHRVAYFGYARVPRGERPTLEDMHHAVTFECMKMIHPKDKQEVIYPVSAMAGDKCSFLALLYMTCCANDRDAPLSALTGFRIKGDFKRNWQASPRSRETQMHALFFSGQGKIQVDSADSEQDLNRMFHRLLHAGGYNHDCSSHIRLRYQPRMA